MKITIRQIALQWIRKASGGNRSRDNQYDENYIMWLVRACMAEQMKAEYYTLLNAEYDTLGPRQMIAPFHLDVERETETNRRYVKMPEAFVSLPFGRGIKSVSSYDKAGIETQRRIIPKHNPEISLRHRAGKLIGHIGYYIEGLRLYFDENVEEYNLQKVLVRALVPAPESYGPDDALPVLPETVVGIIGRLSELYQDRGLQDKYNDTNADRGTTVNAQ